MAERSFEEIFARSVEVDKMKRLFMDERYDIAMQNLLPVPTVCEKENASYMVRSSLETEVCFCLKGYSPADFGAMLEEAGGWAILNRRIECQNPAFYPQRERKHMHGVLLLARES